MSFLSFVVPEKFTKTPEKGERIDTDLSFQTAFDKVPCKRLKETKSSLRIKIKSHAITEQKIAKELKPISCSLSFSIFFSFVLNYHPNLPPEIKLTKQKYWQWHMHENCFKAFCLKSFMKYRLQDTLILKSEQYIFSHRKTFAFNKLWLAGSRPNKHIL